MENISPALLDWFYKNRRSLPFREDPTPYHVWLSEVMLQQTRVSAVLPYYYRFLEELPDIPALAACEEEKLHDRWAKYQHTQQILETERRRLHEAHLRTADLRAAMEAAGLAPAAEGGIAEELLRRPEISYPLVAGIIGWGEEITPMLAERLETEIKYAGYIARQDRMIREVARHEKTLIPEDFEYAALTGLTLEAREKLARIRPRNLGQAGRIPGVSPSDV